MFDKVKFLEDSLKESSETKLKTLNECKQYIIQASDMIINAFLKGKKVMFIGNGGSAADCQHLATEFVIRLSHDINRRALPAIALTTDSSNLTAGGNDLGFENVFTRTVEALGNEGDILIVISTSGNSKNIINAVIKAKSMKIISIGFLGGTGGKLKDMTNMNIIIPSENVQRIQEGHITVGHIVCEIVEREMYGKIF